MFIGSIVYIYHVQYSCPTNACICFGELSEDISKPTMLYIKAMCSDGVSRVLRSPLTVKYYGYNREHLTFTDNRHFPIGERM